MHGYELAKSYFDYFCRREWHQCTTFMPVSREQSIYKFSAIAASLGISSLAVAAVYYRFVWNMHATGGEFPVAEAAATLLLTLGGAVSSHPNQ